MSELDLLKLCKQGDMSAFRALYDRYMRAMFNTALRITGHREEAEDVLQDCFVTVFDRIHQFETIPAFGSYLKTTVVNRSIDKVRKVTPIFSELNPEWAEEIPEETTEYNIPLLLNCIEQLPDGFRVVLSLYLLESYSHKEIAQMLNISEGTSKSQYNRGRKKLADLYHTKMMNHAER